MNARDVIINHVADKLDVLAANFHIKGGIGFEEIMSGKIESVISSIRYMQDGEAEKYMGIIESHLMEERERRRKKKE